MAGRRLPDYRLLNLRYGERFQAQDMDKVKPIPSGLLGPIRLCLSRGRSLNPLSGFADHNMILRSGANSI